jgi:hypothetical protein
MSSDPLNSSAASADRRPAVWPWLLLPFIVLALFFALRSVTPGPSRHAAHPEAASESAPGEGVESR